MAATQTTAAARKPRPRWFQFSLRTLLLLVLLVGIGLTIHGIWQDRVRQRKEALAKQERALAEFNRGAALMEQYRYTEAVAAFDTVLKLAPNWVPARFNLGLAHYYAGSAAEDTKAARVAFEEILQAEPDHTNAHYCLGLHYLYCGQYEKALEQFQAVRAVDPDDQHVAYMCAWALEKLGQDEQATEILERAVANEPGSMSAVYRLAKQYKRAGRAKEARQYLDRFSELRKVELLLGSYSIDGRYGTAGRYAMMLGTDGLPLIPSRQRFDTRFVFSPTLKYLDRPTMAWRSKHGSVNLPGIAVEDVDIDGDLDLCLTGLDEQGRTALYLNNGSGSFTIGPTLADRGVSPCFADVDNDGASDLWLGRAGPDLLLQCGGLGQFTKATATEAICGADELTTCARLLDLDSDGDLELVASRLRRGSVPPSGNSTPAASSVYNNNRDGSFVDVAEQFGFGLHDVPIAAVIHDDLDNDWDMDVILCPAGDREPIVWVNDRAGKYRILDATATGLDIRRVTSVTSGDPDRDGDRDLLVSSEQGLRLFVNQGSLSFQSDAGFADRFGRLGGTGGQFADMDNDGDLDVVIADAQRSDGSRGPALLANNDGRDGLFSAAKITPRKLFENISFSGNASCVVADFTGNGRCDVFLAPAGAKPFLIENVTTGGHWIELDLIGMRRKDRTTQSSQSAVGARVEVRSGVISQQHVVGVPSGPVAMPPLRVHAGLGPNSQVDWLRIRWPDAQLQSELGIAADQVRPIGETSHKRSSCPHLFAWDGSRFQFVSDFGGVGGLGYWIGPEVFAQPDATEYVRIPRLEPRDGEYVLQVVESLQEVLYFDEAKLIAVDHPEGTEVYPNEMAAVTVSPPPFEIFCVRQPIEPIRAVDHRGVDVTEKVRRIDRRCAGATDLDGRFRGYADHHFVELDFGERLGQLPPDCRLVLFLYGWVEYPYSSTNYAARQAGLRTRAPSIHVLRDGKWVELYHEVGYPAGIQHMMTLEMTGKLLPTDRTFRISSNMEIYWDQIYLAPHLDNAALSIAEISAESADLHFLGYPREYSPDGRHPSLYDYANVSPTADWKTMQGAFTRFGDVTSLLGEADDCYAVMGHGEEVTLRFSVDAFGPTPPGSRRTFILKTDSYCKDMDLYTAHPHTVDPLPFHGMSSYPYDPDEGYPDTPKTRQYQRQFNTRCHSAFLGLD